MFFYITKIIVLKSLLPSAFTTYYPKPTYLVTMHNITALLLQSIVWLGSAEKGRSGLYNTNYIERDPENQLDQEPIVIPVQESSMNPMAAPPVVSVFDPIPVKPFSLDQNTQITMEIAQTELLVVPFSNDGLDAPSTFTSSSTAQIQMTAILSSTPKDVNSSIRITSIESPASFTTIVIFPISRFLAFEQSATKRVTITVTITAQAAKDFYPRPSYNESVLTGNHLSNPAHNYTGANKSSCARRRGPSLEADHMVTGSAYKVSSVSQTFIVAIGFFLALVSYEAFLSLGSFTH